MADAVLGGCTRISCRGDEATPLGQDLSLPVLHTLYSARRLSMHALVSHLRQVARNRCRNRRFTGPDLSFFISEL